MRFVKRLVLSLGVLTAVPLSAATLPQDVVDRMKDADVVLLGEVHDNPAHHDIQVALVKELTPRAIVWEMLTSTQASKITSNLLNAPDRLETLLNWAESGWPTFAMYYPIFAAAPEARFYGGEVPRHAAMTVGNGGAAVAFGADAARYGLTVSLPKDEQARREALQFDAHCQAVPMEHMATMVDIQRLRDATLAREVVRALEQTGGPVVVITGNGHARKDWGIPVYLNRVRADLKVFSLGQTENGASFGDFDAIVDSEAPERDDPCSAFSGHDRDGG